MNLIAFILAYILLMSNLISGSFILQTNILQAILLLKLHKKFYTILYLENICKLFILFYGVYTILLNSIRFFCPQQNIFV